MFLQSLLVFQVVDYRGDYTDVLQPRSILVAVLNAELSLVCCTYLAQFAIRVYGKLLGCLAGIFGSLGNHLGLYLVQTCELVADRRALVIFVAYNGNTLAH